LLFMVMSPVSCGNKGKVERLATYLQEEKRLREKPWAPAVLKDSLESLQQKYGIDIDAELSRLGRNPNEWITLLRELRRE